MSNKALSVAKAAWGYFWRAVAFLSKWAAAGAAALENFALRRLDVEPAPPLTPSAFDSMFPGAKGSGSTLEAKGKGPGEGSGSSTRST